MGELFHTSDYLPDGSKRGTLPFGARPFSQISDEGLIEQVRDRYDKFGSPTDCP